MHPHAGLMSAESQKRPSQSAQEQKTNFQCSHWIRSTCLRVTRTRVKFFKMLQLNLKFSKYSKCFYFKICSWSYSTLLVSCSNLFSEKVQFDNMPNLKYFNGEKQLWQFLLILELMVSINFANHVP
jgi:hypothetical protein